MAAVAVNLPARHAAATSSQPSGFLATGPPHLLASCLRRGVPFRLPLPGEGPFFFGHGAQHFDQDVVDHIENPILAFRQILHGGGQFNRLYPDAEPAKILQLRFDIRLAPAEPVKGLHHQRVTGGQHGLFQRRIARAVQILATLHNQTTLTDQNGHKKTKQFNDWGNTVSTQSEEGKAQFSKYEHNESGGSGRLNQLNLASKLQNTVGNMAYNGSFEAVAAWATNPGCPHSPNWDFTSADHYLETAAFT